MREREREGGERKERVYKREIEEGRGKIEIDRERERGWGGRESRGELEGKRKGGRERQTERRGREGGGKERESKRRVGIEREK